jgi:hypothetical protein
MQTRVRVMVFNATFNNISVISWWSVLFVKETKSTNKTDCHDINETLNKILVTVTQSVTNVPQMNNTSTSGMNEE